jgi:hypothetical protein
VDKKFGHSGSLWYIFLEDPRDKYFACLSMHEGISNLATLTFSSSVTRLSSSMGSQRQPPEQRSEDFHWQS